MKHYPDHWRVTFGRNLLGRAFLDAGSPSLAAVQFLENYQADSAARRAPDSLLLFARSMAAMGEARRACDALGLFGESYPEHAAGRLHYQLETTRNQVDCTG